MLNDRRTDLIAVQGALTDPGARMSTPLPVAEAAKTDLTAAQQKLDTLPPAQNEQLGRNLSAQQDKPVQEATGPAR